MRTSATKAFWGRKAMAVALSATMCVAFVPAATFAAANAEAADDGYTYLFASIPYDEYWENEGVYLSASANGDWAASNDELDTSGQTDKGAFDAVSRATTNHGLHRGSYTSVVTIIDEAGNNYTIFSWADDGSSFTTTDGTTYGYSKGTITTPDGATHTLAQHLTTAYKFVPVKVANSDLDAFKAAYTTYENGSTIAGGYSETKLKAISYVADANANTNGLKTATKAADGSFSFSAAAEGTDTGLNNADGTDLAQKTASSDITVLPQVSSSYGDNLRVDLGGDYGDLGANMYAVEWAYYGDGDVTGTPLATYGTKFAADNWMHKSKHIQLGLTEGYRCEFPGNTGGAGNWTVTIKALGYKDVTYSFVATNDESVVNEDTKDANEDNVYSASLIRPDTVEPVSDTSELQAAIDQAKALKEEDYVPASWAANYESIMAEVEEAEEILADTSLYSQAGVNEQVGHITSAIKLLEEKATQKITGGVAKATIKAAGKKTNEKHSFKIGCTAKTSLTYKLTSISKKAKGKVTVAKNGKVTVKKGLKKGKYTAKVKITAAATDAYKAATKMFSVKIIVK